MGYAEEAKKKADLIRAARESKTGPKPDALATLKTYAKAEDVESRIRVVVDNSGSMNGGKIEDAKKGIIEFLRNCRLNQDAVAIHLLNAGSKEEYLGSDEESAALTTLSPNIFNSTLLTDLALLASNVDTKHIYPTGGTPLFETIINALKAKPKLTRMVAFSDGDPDFGDRNREKEAIELAVSISVPIDTVFFGQAGSTGAGTMKRVADATGGIFLVFDPAKGVNFASAFKYLAPGKRLMLADKSFAEKLQRGEVK
jgi:Mg-chelatase subunit ChlD